jgi:beta-galactosidase
VLPRGEQTLADVPYHITDYATAPTPDVIILGGESRRYNPEHVRGLPDRVEGIRVGRRADLLYFLHTAHVGGPVTERERARMNDARRPFELPIVMKYVLHYADGQTTEIPVVLERQIDHWDREQPAPLFEARVAWRQPLDTLEGREAVLYSMQAANPRPDVAIESIDIVRTSERAVPAVLGITLGEVIQFK